MNRTTDDRTTDDLPPAAILGIGVITSLGRGLDAQKVGMSAPPPIGDRPCRVDDAMLRDESLSRFLRRADRFSKMAVLAAADAHAMARSDDTPTDPAVALIVASGFGPHARTFRFLDGILDHGDAAALPTDFSHSVHNVVSGYITQCLNITGRSCTVTNFRGAFAEAVRLAQCWLAGGDCTRVLVGAVDELGEVAIHLASRMMDQPVIGGEGAIFLELGPVRSTRPDQITLRTTDSTGHTDLFIADDLPLDLCHADCAPPARSVTVRPWFGHTACAEAFGLLGAMLTLRHNQPFGRPIHPDEPSPGDGATLNTVAVGFANSYNENLTLLLERTPATIR